MEERLRLHDLAGGIYVHLKDFLKYLVAELLPRDGLVALGRCGSCILKEMEVEDPPGAVLGVGDGQLAEHINDRVSNFFPLVPETTEQQLKHGRNLVTF